MNQLDNILNKNLKKQINPELSNSIEILDSEIGDLIRGGDKEYKPIEFQRKSRNNWLRGVTNIFS